MRRPEASLRHGQLYEKNGSYYGCWRTPDGRRLNRRLGAVRAAGQSNGITRAQAERAFRKVQAREVEAQAAVTAGSARREPTRLLCYAPARGIVTLQVRSGSSVPCSSIVASTLLRRRSLVPAAVSRRRARRRPEPGGITPVATGVAP